jgi:hypothetical protein
VALLTLWIWCISLDVAWGALIYLATWSWIPGLLLLRARLLGREQPGHRGELSHAAQVLLALLLIGLVGGGFAIALRVSHWPASGHYVAAAMMAFLCCLLCVLGILLLLTRL